MASMGILNMLLAMLMQFRLFHATKNKTVAATVKLEPVKPRLKIAAPASLTLVSAAWRPLKLLRIGSCDWKTVPMSLSSPPDSTPSHRLFASDTTLPQSNRSPRFCSDPVAVAVAAQKLAVLVILRYDVIGAASAVGRVNWTSPELSPLSFAVAVEKRIGLCG